MRVCKEAYKLPANLPSKKKSTGGAFVLGLYISVLAAVSVVSIRVTESRRASRLVVKSVVKTVM